jgi:hypothetical protein
MTEPTSASTGSYTVPQANTSLEEILYDLERERAGR